MLNVNNFDENNNRENYSYDNYQCFFQLNFQQ